METKFIYLVYEKEMDGANDLYGVFDSEALAEAYVGRFKERLDLLEILKVAANPSLRGDKSRNPYGLSLRYNGETTVFPCYHPTETERAIDGEYTIFDAETAYPSLTLYLLAESTEEAWVLGKPRLEELVAMGIFRSQGKPRLVA